MQTVRDKMLAAIRRGRGWAFSAKDFLGLANRGAIDVTLSALAADGSIRRIGRGLYDYPKKSDLVDGPLPPDLDQAARAIARKHRWTITPDGATAANMLGLSQQVPTQIVYLSDGPSRQFTLGKRKIRFRHASPKDLRMENYSSRIIAQALRFLGKDNVDDKVLAKLRRDVPKSDRRALLKDARYATDWILDVAQKIAGQGGQDG